MEWGGELFGGGWDDDGGLDDMILKRVEFTDKQFKVNVNYSVDEPL